MKCREFKSNHVGFIDDLLPAADMSAMRRHLAACARCATLDIRIRRSLLVVRNLPQIEPSADFFARLSEALQHAPPPEPKYRPLVAAAAFTGVTAALAAAVYFAMAISPGAEPAPVPAAQIAETPVVAPVAPAPMNEVAIAAAVPAGVPVWPAMFMVSELPTHFTNAELLDPAPGR
jgi:anti-sigma factor RsiW